MSEERFQYFSESAAKTITAAVKVKGCPTNVTYKVAGGFYVSIFDNYTTCCTLMLTLQYVRDQQGGTVVITGQTAIRQVLLDL